MGLILWAWLCTLTESTVHLLSVIGLKGLSRVEQELFSAALGLVPPWRVVRSEFDAEAGRLDLYLEFPRGARFPCPLPGCAQLTCPVHDSDAKTWRHLDFFQYQAHLHAKVPRVRCPQHRVHQVAVSWARPESGFTLLFEALLITFAAAMPVAQVAKFTGEQDTRIWRVLEHYVKRERAKLDFSGVEKVGVDETAAARGQDYVSIFMDPDRRRVLFATEGRDRSTVQRFVADLKAHGGYPELVGNVTCDMSVAFISGVTQYLANADITFDRFHIMKKLGEAVDEVRRAEVKHRPLLLKKTRWLWLTNRHNLSVNDQRALVWLTRPSVALARPWPPPGRIAGARTSRASTTNQPSRPRRT